VTRGTNQQSGGAGASAPAGALRLGVSACLLGIEVRYDGGHKRDPFLAERLGSRVEWVPVCPEVEAGFGTPREPMHLVRGAGVVRLRAVHTRRDLTPPLQAAVTARLQQLASLNLDGYVLKAGSPSCGLVGVEVRDECGQVIDTGRGLFAAGLADALPLLPLEDERRLNDPAVRDAFLDRVFAYRRLRHLGAHSVGAGELMRFHARHKLLLLAHSPSAYARLGQIVASATGRVARALFDRYAAGLMEGLSVPATRGRHVNVLQHMAGYFEAADAAERAQLAAVVQDYERGLVPLAVPLTRIAGLARRYDVRYLLDQVYLQPDLHQVECRNHV
jgi:uncharacterized protein YbgA (DUF1722 family)/uncharacterized protein YbbK (DUF523 family)